MPNAMNLMPQVYYDAITEGGGGPAEAPDAVVGAVDASNIPDDIGVPGAPTEEGGDGESAPERGGLTKDEQSLLDLDEDAWDSDKQNQPPDEGQPGDPIKAEEAKAEGEEGKEGEEQQTAQPDDLAAALKEAGFENAQEVAEMVATMNENNARWKMLAEAAGMKFAGDNVGEHLDEFENAILDARRAAKDRDSQDAGAGAGQTQKAAGDGLATLDDVFTKHSTNLDFGEHLKGFYTDVVGVLVNAATNAINERLGGFETQAELNNARAQFDRAKAALNDDEAMPTFREAYQFLQLNPEFVTRAQERFEVFKDVDANPMQMAIEKWRSMKGSAGISKGEERKRDTAAKKVRDLKKLGKPTRIPAAAQKPSDELAAMAESMDNIPFEKF